MAEAFRLDLPLGQKRTRASRPKARSGCDTYKCQRLGRKCEGYPAASQEPPKRQQKRQQPIIRPLQPKSSQTLQPILWEPSNALFNSEKDHRYFRVFCDKIAFQLDGILPSDLWSRLMLQACEHSTSQDLTTTLITCLIIICFETFHGSFENAFSQITTGLRVIEEAASKRNTSQICMDGISSSMLTSVDAQLIRAFVRLDLQAMSFVESRTTNIHAFQRGFGLVDLSSMPTRFQTLKEARHYLELVMLQFMHFASSMMQHLQLAKSGGVEDIHLLQCLSTPISMDDESGYYLITIQRWHDAFQPLATYARSISGKEISAAASALKCHYLTARFAMEGMSPSSSTPKLKSFMPYFLEIVSLAKTILGHQNLRPKKSLFTFDTEITVPLYVVGCWCPQSGARREAIALMSSTPRREGLWDGVMAGKIMEWILEVEEEGVVDGLDIEEGIRWRKFESAKDLQKTKAQNFSKVLRHAPLAK
ncbi:uncharacterized protein PAC_10605 [Phialocephala subalpina]|uniref:Zn(2)-C6 fungal-type domain-containing protein n=1 Tax=Phialocephala subalpina TaxID=576137 RepID=A0A1L7X6R6_9HELO|nr:uncharacterized protein PAC_10605 [Phialocephala subalpina]